MCKYCSVEMALPPAFEQALGKHNSRIIKAIFDGTFNTIVDMPLLTDMANNFKFTIEQAIDGASENPTEAFLDIQTKLNQNALNFTVYKNAKFVQELKQAASLITDFKEYLTTAKSIAKNYNINYLKTETNWAARVSAQATRWQDIQLKKDSFPFLKFNTREDERVRYKHTLLNDKVFPVEDPIWLKIYPPISGDWGCRCFVTQEFEAGDAQLPKNPFDAYPDSPAITLNIFDKNHPYFKGFSKTQKDELNKLSTSI